MLASILFWLIIIHYAMMVFAPLFEYFSPKQVQRVGLRVLFSWLGMFCGVGLFKLWINSIGGISPFLPTSQAQYLYFYGTWAAFFGGLAIVVFGFIKGSRLRKQQRATVTN
jgi:hypothetical protein